MPLDIQNAFKDAAIKWNDILIKDAKSDVQIWLAISSGEDNVYIKYEDIIEPIAAETIMDTNPFDESEYLFGEITVSTSNQSQNSTYLRAMAMHELGHVLGLNETKDTTIYSIMRPSMQYIQYMSKPGNYDINNIKHLTKIINI